MKKKIAVCCGAALIMLAGCAPTYPYAKKHHRYPKPQQSEYPIADTISAPTQPPAVIAPPAPISSLATTTEQMVTTLVNSAALSQMSKNGLPIIFVDEVKNKTAEYVNTQALTESINQGLYQSGKVGFVDLARVDSVRKTLNISHSNVLVNPGTAIEFGKMVGAQYMLYGTLSESAALPNTPPYKMTMRLMDLETGLIEWTQAQDIFQL